MLWSGSFWSSRKLRRGGRAAGGIDAALPEQKMGRARRRAQDGVASGRSETFGDVETDDARVEREDIGAQARVVAVGEAVGDRRVVEEILDVKLHREQIGRASCRERVCQYV